MTSALRETIRRRLLPSTVVRLSRLRGPARACARLSRALGRPPELELYFAYDDPYAAVALPPVVALAEAHRARLSLYPLLQRGIADDPAATARARHSVVDAGRLLARDGQGLSRREPLSAGELAFLAGWTQAARRHPAVGRFAAAALARLWLQSAGPVQAEDFAALHQTILGHAPATDDPALRGALARNHHRLLARGHWESPALRLAGEWFFAHERLPMISARLAELSGVAP